MRLYTYFLFALAGLPLFSQSSNSAGAAVETQASAAIPQAVDARVLLLRAIEVGGGRAKLSAISDFVAHAAMTSGDEKQGQATIRGSGETRFRMDSELDGEASSWAVGNGTGQYKTSNMRKAGTIPSYNAVNAGWLTLPYLRIARVLDDRGVELRYLGLQSIGETSAHQIRVIRHFPKDQDPQDLLSTLQTADYYLDSADLRIIRVVDSTHPDRAAIGLDSYGHLAIRKIPRVISYSDFRTVDGLSVPFAVTEEVAHQRIWTLRLSDIAFNTGQSDSDFTIQ